MWEQVVLVNDVLREEGEWYSHVFVPVEQSTEVEILDIDSHESCIFSAENTVPNDLGGCEIRCSSCELMRVIYEISPAVIRTLFGSDFCGLKSTTIRAYVTDGFFPCVGRFRSFCEIS